MPCFKRPCKILAFCFTLYLFFGSQELFGQKFSVGVKAGGILNWAHFGDSEDRSKFDSKIKSGYMAGGTIAFPLKNRYTFLAEAAYAVKGRRVMFDDKTLENNNTYTFIDLSMFLRRSFHLHIKENLPTEWYLNVGPQVSHWLTAKGKILNDDYRTPYTIVFNQPPDANFKNLYYNNVNRWLFALALGVGFEAPIKKTQKVNIEFRFVSGHTYLGDKGSAYIEILGFDDTSLKQNLKEIQITLGYTFDFDVQQSRKGKSTLDKKIKRKRN
ncbi:MAG: porin family protein [Bacteroidota bacterium]